MVRRPTREWLEALVSGALLSGCAGSAAAPTPPVAPTPAASGATTGTSPAATTAPAPSSAPAATSAAPTSPPTAAGVQLAAFDPSSCKGPSPARKEPACAPEKQADPGADDSREGSPQDLANVRPGCAVDAVVVFHAIAETMEAGQKVPPHADEVARAGEPCAAADKEACEARLKRVEFPNKGGFGEGFYERTFVVVAQGGELKLVSTREQLLGLLGAIDSKQDAAALLWLEGWGGSCARLQAQGTSFVLPKLKAGLICPAMQRGRAGMELIPSVPEAYEKDGNYRLSVDQAGKLKASYLGGASKENFGRACGRRPSDMALGCVHDDSAGSERAQVGAYLAESARLEAAAVFAFELMAGELWAHGAPEALVERCRVAADDERRHAELTTLAARRYGVEPLLPAPHARPLPTLLELARENTVEGCVRETWGALSAALQARTAQDPELAALYASIAPDELAHAELSWDIHDWLAERTDAAQLAQLAQLAHAELVAEQTDPSPSVTALAGAPTRVAARALLRQLAA